MANQYATIQHTVVDEDQKVALVTVAGREYGFARCPYSGVYFPIGDEGMDVLNQELKKYPPKRVDIMDDDSRRKTLDDLIAFAPNLTPDNIHDERWYQTFTDFDAILN